MSPPSFAMPGTLSSSSLLLEELLDAGDRRVLGELLGLRKQSKLPSIAQRLLTDTRPFARDVLREYIDHGCDEPGHRVFVKTVFKAAEKANDLELMAHFGVAFDRLVRRSLVTETHWDWQTSTSVTAKVLREPKTLLRRLPRWRRTKREYQNPVTGRTTTVRRPFIPLGFSVRNWNQSRKVEELADPLTFTFSTRRYLQRRAWRFFRQLGKRSPSSYREHIVHALALFRDEHLSSPEALLDSWFLIHALYGRSTVLERKPLGIVVAKGESLTDLRFAPFFPEVWNDCLEALIGLALAAQSRPVRRFAIWALETNHRAQLDTLDGPRLLPLLKSPHLELQTLGSQLLERASGLENLPIDSWLELLSISDVDALLGVCAAVKKHVAPSRLTLAQCIGLACSRAAPVAELGLAWAKDRPVRSASDIELLLKLRHAETPSVRSQGVEWLAGLLVLEDTARPLFVRELLDARHIDVRGTAMSLMKKDTRFGESVDLWLAMSETPYADVRDQFLKDFESREEHLSPDTLSRVWATTLLSVHRGSRAKRHAVRQVADRIVSKPNERADLVKLLSHALRSVRASERHSALSQMVRAATADSGLRELLARDLPELTLLGDEVTE